MDVIALPGIQQMGASKLADTSVATDAVSSDRPIPDVREEIRRLIAAGWVEELVVRCDSQPDSLREVIEAGRLAGRKVRLISAAPVSQLPLARNRERWSSEIRDGDQTSVLLPHVGVRAWGLALKRLIDVVVAATPARLALAGPPADSRRCQAHNRRPDVLPMAGARRKRPAIRRI